MTRPLQIHTIVSLPFSENTYILWREGGEECLVVDPGLEPDAILDFLKDKGLTPAAILNTHGHADHIGGNEAMKAAFPNAPLVIGRNEAPLLTDANLNVSGLFGFPIVSPPADRLVVEGDKLDYAGIPMDVVDLPGHSPGHVLFVLRVEKPMRVLGGDVLFRGGIGRSDFPGSDEALLYSGIRDKVYALPEDTVVYPGHGPVTTVGHEKRTNPFVRV